MHKAHELVRIFQEKSASQLAYKKHGTIKRENIIRWREGVRCMVCYFGKEKQCRALFHFLNESDAALFKEFVDNQLQKEYQWEIFDVE